MDTDGTTAEVHLGANGTHAGSTNATSSAAASRGIDPFDALGDPTRRHILRLLAAEPRPVGALARQLPISRPAVSRHLRLLKDAGLVEERAEGTRRIYRLHDDGVGAVRSYLEQVWGDAATRFRLMADNTAPTDTAPKDPTDLEPGADR